MRQLEKAHGGLEKEVNKWKINIFEKVDALERQSTVMLRINDAFRSAIADHGLGRLEIGGCECALLMGNLPPELFPPAQLRTVIGEIRMPLQVGLGSYTVTTEGGFVRRLWRLWPLALTKYSTHQKFGNKGGGV